MVLCEPEAADPRTVSPEVETVGPKDLNCIRERRDFRRNPGLALGLFHNEPIFGQGMYPHGPKREEVRGFHDENHIIYVGQKLNDLCGVSVREAAFCLRK